MIKFPSKQTGSVHVIIIVIMIVVICSALGFVVSKNLIFKDKPVAENNSTQAVTSDKPKDTKSSSNKVDTSIHSVDIKMQSTADIGQLPSYTPASFKSYMQKILENNVPSKGIMSDCGNVVVEYQISKISQVNIQGGVVPVNEEGQTCPGGAPVIWVLTPSGTWDKESLNGPVCKSKNGGLIYEEFEPQCYTGELSANEFIKNPNGSITLLNK